MLPLNIFYQEPDPDRWIKFDHYPRRVIRRIVRGKSKPGGVMMVALNLMKGLDKIGVPYRFNDFNYIKKHPNEIACIIGKPHLIFNKSWKNPIILGAGIYSHPVDCPDIFERFPNIQRLLVPGDWMKEMFIPYYGDKVTAWPTGIDTDEWKETDQEKEFDFLIYIKIRWKYDQFEDELINPIKKILLKQNLTHTIIKYGQYDHEELKSKLSRSRAAIFLCEHETQGLAYQQILSTNTPILAWDRAGFWQDPTYFPHKVQFEPVSSVPYWDNRCGGKFTGAADLENELTGFQKDVNNYKPRNYIMENLSLEICAQKYIDIYKQVEAKLNS